IGFNLTISVLWRNKTFLLNAMAITSLLALDLYISGFGNTYIWRGSAYLSNYILSTSIVASGMFGALFAHSLLTAAPAPHGGEFRPARLLLLFVPAYVALFLLQLILRYEIIVLAGLICAGLLIVAMAGTAAAGIWRRHRPAFALSLPLLFAIVPGVGITAAEHMFADGAWTFSSHSFEIFLVLEALLFSSVLAMELRNMEWDRDRAVAALSVERNRASQRLVHAIDEERRRVASDLHDMAGQGLLMIASRLDTLRQSVSRRIPPDSTLDEVSSYSRVLVNDIRRIAHDLHPSEIDHLGLQTAIEQLCANLENAAGIRTTLDYRIDADLLSQLQEIQVYRIVQEALSNIAKHSKARNAALSFRPSAAAITVTIHDDGVGLPAGAGEPGRHTLGMTVIDRRVEILGGSWSKSSRQGGTHIEIRFPAVGPG
ncbi:MAG: hypothetical protein KDJ29_03615, partial [Hyphomicrobiales bacterium]|nr:hypothetical protein [Hyphomicrobiales bacterium]